MKFKALARSEKKCTRELSTDVKLRPRNTSAEVHPFAQSREYRRALNATKLDRVFAKPFIGALDGHTDGVWCSASPHDSLVQFISGSCDGEVRVWDLASRKCVWSIAAHRGIVKGVSVAPGGTDFFVSAGDDSQVKLWGIAKGMSAYSSSSSSSSLSSSSAFRDVDPAGQNEPLAIFNGKDSFTGVDHHWTRSHFATSSELIEVWDHNRSEPIQSFKWGHDATLSVRFNPAEPELLASTGRDRTVGIYDLRAGTSLRKVMLEAYCSAMAWNPREPYYFVSACEDSNLYSFDMRKMDRPTMIHKDHVGAVLSVGFSPTGREFVSGGYDRTIRIFGHNSGRSREIYHNRRMGRVFSTNFSQDGRYVLSGSEDTNLRIWKARASESVAKPAVQEERHLEYIEALKKKHAHMPEVRRIAKHRQVPKLIKKMQQRITSSRESERRKESNRRAHTRPGTKHSKSERDQAVIADME